MSTWLVTKNVIQIKKEGHVEIDKETTRQLEKRKFLKGLFDRGIRSYLASILLILSEIVLIQFFVDNKTYG